MFYKSVIILYIHKIEYFLIWKIRKKFKQYNNNDQDNSNNNNDDNNNKNSNN